MTSIIPFLDASRAPHGDWNFTLRSHLPWRSQDVSRTPTEIETVLSVPFFLNKKDHAFLHDPYHLFLLIRFFIYEAPMLFLLVLLNHTLMFLTSFIVINRHKQDITCIAQNRGWIFPIFDLLHGRLRILIPFYFYDYCRIICFIFWFRNKYKILLPCQVPVESPRSV